MYSTNGTARIRVLAALADLGYPPHDRYFKPTPKPGLGGDYVNWGSGRKAMHEWITVDALSVLHAAGRL